MNILFSRIAKWLIVIAVPVWLAITGVQLVASPLFLTIEYHRPGFPEDYYGFTVDDRMTYAPIAIEYLRNNEGIEFLGDLTFDDGTAMYSESELVHMEDVKIVFYMMSLVYVFVFILIVGGSGYISSRKMTTRNTLTEAFHHGSILTLAIIAVILGGALISWDTFFTGFHKLFFADGTWRFLYSDTLIRLFPEQFWFDAALTVGGFTVIGALIIFVVTWRDQRKKMQ